MTEISALTHDDLYSGNAIAFEDLTRELRSENIIAFVGAGASAPLIPTWTSTLRLLIEEASTRGLIAADEKECITDLVDKDPLECASQLEKEMTRENFRSRLMNFFGNLNEPTKIQSWIVDLRVKGIITLNYDLGLEQALSNKLGVYPSSDDYTNKYAINTWRQRSALSADRPPVMHMHGVAKNRLDRLHGRGLPQGLFRRGIGQVCSRGSRLAKSRLFRVRF